MSETPSQTFDDITPGTQAEVDRLVPGDPFYPEDPALAALQTQSYHAARRLWENIETGRERDQAITQREIATIERDQAIDKSEHDKLTGLYNREGFMNHMKAIHEQDPKNCVGILFIDLDGFKSINDRFGHDTGDRALEMFSSWLDSKVRHDRDDRPGDLAATRSASSRNSGDEFIVGAVFNDIQKEDILERSSNFRQRLKNEFQTYLEETPELKELGLGMSVGIAAWDWDAGISLEEAKKKADDDMYLEKRLKKAS